MTAPRIAICLPAAPTSDGLEMLYRTLAALHSQDCPAGTFEVCVGIDGGTAEDISGAIPHPGADQASYDITLASVRRTKGKLDIPHRNHARNAAWRAARAPLCWMLDADFILPPHAVRHVLAEHDAAMLMASPAVLSPCLWQFGGASTEQWWARSAGWADVPGRFSFALDKWPEFDRGVFSGFGDLATNGAASGASKDEPASASVGLRMVEGMPVLWRGFLEAVGGFDEAYVGWGGDKISLIDIIRGLCREGVLDIRVVTSVAAIHQPHATDPTHTSRRSVENEKRRAMARMPIESRTLEWRRRIPGLVAGLQAGWAAAGHDVTVDATVADVLQAVTDATRRRVRSPLVAIPIGPSAGMIRAHLERSGVPVRASGVGASGIVVSVNPLGASPDGWHEKIAGVRAMIESVPGQAGAVIAQRLDFGLRPLDLQTSVIRNARDARAVRIGGHNWAVVGGQL